MSISPKGTNNLQAAMKAADDVVPAQLLTDEEMAALGKRKPAPPMRLASAENLVAERKGQHGDWAEQAALAADLKRMIRRHTETAQGSKLTTSQQEALEMICVKISRICCGDPNHPDHFQDIMGYALLGLEGHKR